MQFPHISYGETERKYMDLKFKSELHYRKFIDILSRMKRQDCYHLAAAYLIAMDLYDVAEAVFDFAEDRIKPLTSLKYAWHTSSTLKTTRLMQNLWNGCVSDYPGCSIYPENGESDVSPYYAVDEIFCNSENAPFYWEAVRLRFEMI